MYDTISLYRCIVVASRTLLFHPVRNLHAARKRLYKYRFCSMGTFLGQVAGLLFQTLQTRHELSRRGAGLHFPAYDVATYKSNVCVINALNCQPPPPKVGFKCYSNFICELSPEATPRGGTAHAQARDVGFTREGGVGSWVDNMAC